MKELLSNEGIVRNRLKIAATVQNAKAFLKVRKEFGSFDAYVWQFVGGQPKQNNWKYLRQLPAKTEESDTLSKDLRKRGFQLRRVNDLLCLHAGGGHGERPHRRIASGADYDKMNPSRLRSLFLRGRCSPSSLRSSG